jgi:tRNA modification GTPase
LPPDVLVAVRAELAVLVAEMKRELGGSRVAERLRSGFEVAIVGPPNVGKSTLFNALAGREAALVSAAPGTTRDVIEVRLDLEGLPLTVLDTAGIRDAAGEIEALGIERARARAEAADVRIFLVGSAAEVDALDVPSQPGDLVIRGKADLDPDAGGVSGLTGQGIESMLAEVATVLGARMAGASSLGHARQREAVTRTLDAIEVALEELGGLAPRIELVAEDLRTAVRALDFLVGRVDVEAILDVVFGTFCLGK